MNKTLKIVGMAAMVLLLAASCKKEGKENGGKQMMTFSAGIAQGGAKTYLQPNGTHSYAQYWSENDQIRVNEGVLTLDAGFEGKTSGTFSGELKTADKYYAIYPATATLSGSKATFTLPEEQIYNGNGYAKDLWGPMYASSNTQQLQFNNLCGLLQLNLYSGFNNKPLKVNKIVVKPFEPDSDKTAFFGTSNEVDLTVENPTLFINGEAADQTATLVCEGDGVTLGTDVNNPTPFLITLPPYVFACSNSSGGLYVDVYANGVDQVYVGLKYHEEVPIVAGEVTYTNAKILPELLVQTTSNAADITSNSARVSGKYMTANGDGIEYQEIGIVYQNADGDGGKFNPDIAEYVKYEAQTSKDGEIEYYVNLTGLESKTTYRYWAYVRWNYRDGSYIESRSNDSRTFSTLIGR